VLIWLLDFEFIDEIILFLGSFYVHNSLFAECVDTSWRLEACGNINSAAYPLFTLLNMLGIEPYRKVMNLYVFKLFCWFVY
jgi:DNA repair protein RAD5